MSNEAINWAFGQSAPKSSAKFVLVAMANLAGDDMTCWPSVAYLADATGQDRKTVLEGIKRLREAGLIEDTGVRKGNTKSVVVYRLCGSENGTASAAGIEQSKPENGTAKQSQKRSSSEIEAVPNFPISSPVFPHKQSRFSLEAVPKTGHGTLNEPLMNHQGTQKKRSAFDASTAELPDWLSRDVWCAWARDRKARGKSMTEDAARLSIKSLEKLKDQGHDPQDVIENAIASGWQGLYAPRATNGGGSGNRQEALEKRNQAVGDHWLRTFV